MSNSTTLQVLLKAVDLASRPFKAIQTASLSLSGNIENTRHKLGELNAQAAQIDGYRATESELNLTGKALVQAKVDTQQLAVAFKNNTQPIQTQGQALASARDNVNALKQKHTDLRLALQHQRLELLASGTSSAALTGSDGQLRKSITQTTGRLSQQQKQLEQIHEWKQKVSSVKEGYQRRKGYADRATAIGTAGLTLANNIIAPRAAAAQKQEVTQPTQDGKPLNPLSAKTQPLFAAPDIDNLNSDLAKLTAAKNKLSVDWFAPQAGSQRLLLQTATGYLEMLDSWVQKNGELVQTFSIIAAVTAGVAGTIGAIGSVVGPVIGGINMVLTTASLLGPIFEGVAIAIGALSWPVIAVVAVIAGAALLIRKYWEPLSAFFGGLFGGVFEVVQSTFSGIGGILQSLWQTFSTLVEPVRTTEKTLNSCRDAGVMFGKFLAEALLWPINQFKQLIGLGNSLLEFLHLKEKTPQLSAAEPGSNPADSPASYITATSDLSVYDNPTYKAINPGVSRSYSDQSTHNLNFTITGSDATAPDIARTIRQELELYQQENQFNQRARLNFSG